MACFGIGGSSAKTDRSAQLAAQQGLWSTYNTGLGISSASEASGTSDLSSARSSLGTADAYWKSLLSAGRTQTAANSAPAINSVIAQNDATRNAAGTFGTGRTGGTAALNREATTQTGSTIDNIVNQNLIGGRTAGAHGEQQVAAGETAIGSTELNQALQALGIGSNAVGSIMDNATKSRPISQQINQEAVQGYAQAIGQIVSAFMGGG